MTRQAIRRFLLTRRATLARLRRVNEALSAWDEYEMARERPGLFPAPAEPPQLSRAALKSLQQTLMAALMEQEEAWERRN
jgi:hypothetical protein